MMRLTLGIVGRTLFDVDLLDKADRLGADITTIQEYAMKQLRSTLPDADASQAPRRLRPSE